MQYENYKVEDFLFDEFFVKWVKNPGPETTHFWENWIEKNPGKIQTINKAREIITSVHPKNRYRSPDGAYNEVLENVLKQQSSWTQLGYLKKNDRLTSVVKYAAVFLILAGFGALITYLNLQVYNNNQLTSQLIEKINPVGKKITFYLADGTSVKLNAGSTLIYPEKFPSGERIIQLEGEAFFEVARDETRPFIVETKNLKTIVLGTSFNIKAYEDESEFSVAVATGKVKVVKNESDGVEEREYLIEKDQMVVYNSLKNSTTILDSAPDEVFSWKDNIIEFNHTEFLQVVHMLERWYGVKFTIENSRKFEGGFIGKFEGEPLELVLEGLKDQYNFQFEISPDGKNVIIN